VTSRAIRQLHAVGLLPEVPRDGSGSRMYGPAELELLLRISRLKADGLAVDEIARILANGPASGRR
jgi:DNA-binding transcriptional MerR regulator